jgi:hypothetical protein
MAVSSALAACASSAQPVGTAELKQGSNQQSVYKRVTRNGEDYFCRRAPVTGSLTRTVETCLTQAQLDEKAQDARDFVYRTQGVPGQPAGTSPISSGVTQPQ